MGKDGKRWKVASYSDRNCSYLCVFTHFFFTFMFVFSHLIYFFYLHLFFYSNYLCILALFSLSWCLQWNELSTASVTMNMKRTQCPHYAPVCIVRFSLDLCKSTKCMHPHTHIVSPASACVCMCEWVGGRATTPICHPPTPFPSSPL